MWQGWYYINVVKEATGENLAMLTSGSVRYKFFYTSKNNACPLCGKRNGNCRTGKDGDRIRQFCMSFRYGEGAGDYWEFCHTTKDGNWGVYRPKDEWVFERKYKPLQISSRKVICKTINRRRRNSYFNWLLKIAPIGEEDKKILIGKGLSPEEVRNDVFGSISQGILIVFPDVYGYKVGAQVRRRIDKNEGSKYYWYTSKNLPVKLENEQIPVAVWQNKESDKRVVYLCEGYLKSYIAYQQHLRIGKNHPWIGFGAVSYLRSGFKEIEKSIKILNPEKLIFIPDAGSGINNLVKEGYEKFWQELRMSFPKINIFVASWNHEFSKTSPDIDELEDKSIIHFYKLEEYEVYINNVETYNQEERLNVWLNKIEKYKYILDSSPTGTGKSYDAGRLPGPCLYINTDHRNPSTETLANWKDTEGRHGGLYKDSHGYWRRKKHPEQTTVIPSNCHLHEKHEKLKEYGYNSGHLCYICPHLQKCKTSRGEGYGYLLERKLSLMSEKIRIHPDSLPRTDKFDYKNRTIIIEEAGDLDIVASFKINSKTINKTIEIIEREEKILPEDKEKIIKYLNEIKMLIQEQFGKRYGKFNELQVPEISRNGQLSLWELVSEPQGEDEVAENEWRQAIKGEREKLRIANRMLKAETSKIEYLIKEIEESIPPAMIWLLEGKPSWIGNNGYVYVYKVKEEIREAIKQAKSVIFLDATADPHKISLIYDIPVQEIHHITTIKKNTENLEIHQIKDLGKLCSQRGEEQMRRLKELIERYKEIEPSTRVIDLLKFTEDACWWRDSRGRNQFTDCKQLLLIGTPNRSWNHTLCSFLALGGNLKQFQKFYNEQTRSDIIQGIGRIRSNLRTHEKLKVILITNFQLNLANIKEIKSKDICIDAAPKKDRKIEKIINAYYILKEKEVNPTQSAIAKYLNIARETVSRCWQKVKQMLEKQPKPYFTYEKFEQKNAIEVAFSIAEVYHELTGQIDNLNLRRLILNMLGEIPQQEQEYWIKYILSILAGKKNILEEIETVLDSS